MLLNLASKDFCDQAEIQVQCRYINVDRDRGHAIKVKRGKIKFYLNMDALCSAYLSSSSFFLLVLDSLTFPGTNCNVLEFL